MSKPVSTRRDFYRQLLPLTLPIVLQNLIAAAVNSADVLMLTYVGGTALSAVSLANQVQFLIIGFFFGIASAISMMVSQYWGKKDLLSIQAVMGIGLKISLCFTALVAAAAVLFPAVIMRVFTPDPELIDLGARYLRLIGFTYVLQGGSQVYEYTMRSMERANLPTVFATTALLLNIFLNAVFIFGLFGAPQMGVFGVALATLIARSVELLFCLADAVLVKTLRYDAEVLLGAHPALTKDFIHYALPALLNDMVWTVAFSTYSILFGHLGSDVVAANAITSTVRNLCTTAAFGLASAGTILVGKSIGDNRMEEACQNADTLCHLTLLIGVATGVLILMLRPLVFGVYGAKLTPLGQDYLNFMLLVSSYYVVGQEINTLVIAGIFRAGGNTRFGLICDTIDMWCIAVPVGFFCAFVLKVPVKPLYVIICLDEFYKIPVVYHYYKKYTWMKNITREYE